MKTLTFSLGNRFAHQDFNNLRQNVAIVLHPFPSDKIYTWLAIRSANIVLWDPIRGHSSCAWRLRWYERRYDGATGDNVQACRPSRSGNFLSAG
jgi:hypothetical protein